jgi:predicted Rossmann-fold nucleotide-binding protein
VILSGRQHWAPLLGWVNRAMVGVYVEHEDLDLLEVADEPSAIVAQVLACIRRECAHDLSAIRAVG